MQLVGNCVFCPDDTRSSCTFSPWSLRPVAVQKKCTSLLAPCRHPLSTQYIVKLHQSTIWCIYLEHQFGDGAPEPTTKSRRLLRLLKTAPTGAHHGGGAELAPASPERKKKGDLAEKDNPEPPRPPHGGAQPPRRAKPEQPRRTLKSVLQAV